MADDTALPSFARPTKAYVDKPDRARRTRFATLPSMAFTGDRTLALSAPSIIAEPKATTKQEAEEHARFKSMRTQMSHLFKHQDLSVVPVFANCSRDFVETLAEHVQVELFDPGTYIFEQGDVGDCLYILIRGEVEVIHDDTVVAKLADGSVFGEAAAISKKLECAQRSTSIRAVTLCDCRTISRKKVLATCALYKSDEAIIEAVAKQRMEELQETAAKKRHREWWRLPPARSKDEGEDAGRESEQPCYDSRKSMCTPRKHRGRTLSKAKTFTSAKLMPISSASLHVDENEDCSRLWLSEGDASRFDRSEVHVAPRLQRKEKSVRIADGPDVISQENGAEVYDDAKASALESIVTISDDPYAIDQVYRSLMRPKTVPSRVRVGSGEEADGDSTASCSSPAMVSPVSSAGSTAVPAPRLSHVMEDAATVCQRYACCEKFGWNPFANSSCGSRVVMPTSGHAAVTPTWASQGSDRSDVASNKPDGDLLLAALSCKPVNDQPQPKSRSQSKQVVSARVPKPPCKTKEDCTDATLKVPRSPRRQHVVSPDVLDFHTRTVARAESAVSRVVSGRDAAPTAFHDRQLQQIECSRKT